MIEKITTHTQDALDRRLMQYKDGVNWEKFYTIFADRIQEIENVAWEFLSILDIDLMEGAQLDLIGRIVGQPRNELADDLYRIFLKAKIGVNTSRGNWDSVWQVYEILLAGTEGYVWECFPATIQLFYHDSIDSIIEDNLLGVMQQVAGAGIKVWAVSYPDEFLVLGWYDEPDPPEGLGLSWDDDLNYGSLSWAMH